MHDWKKYVREGLLLSPKDGSTDEEIIRELADHLEDVYSDLCGSGWTEAEALRQATRQVGNWFELQRAIAAAQREDVMNARVAKFWLPSLVTLLLGWGILAIFMWAGVQPWMTHPAEARGLIVYVPWLVALPPVGALGAFMARRSDARGWRVYVAAAFPAIAAALVFLTVFPWAMVVDRNVGPDFRFVSLAANTTSWVVLPGLLLSAGGAVEGLVNSRGNRRRPPQ